ncbi:hypothetical protein WMY93_010047 [Mugilogobius chulae]|uniref:DDE Tnp4 domain-containing protein n=1 Tax=Mugilogobius chulae TaxID=88201 RepID=A0AAW0PCJ3_9GOBI
MELIQDFRLSRNAIYALQDLLRREQDHGWGYELQVLVYAYWLARGLSYRVAIQVLCMKSSSFYTSRRYPPTGYFILGDGGYPCLETPVCLITPYREPVNGRVQQSGDILEPDQDAAGNNVEALPLPELSDPNETPGNATRDRVALLL